jgi:2,4-dienoyl-CoA reductase-like NADH-dependent reductase (Old Yellow Enzyme family)
MAVLFTSFRLRDLTFKNRIFVSPMCQYSSQDGLPTDWHLVHLGSRAVGGAALVCVEASAVSPIGRISPADSGIWSDEQASAFKRITAFIREMDCVPAIQLAHAGRKAGTDLPWSGGLPLRAWTSIAPSAIPFARGYPTPREMTTGDMNEVDQQFTAAAGRALVAGFQVVEIHMAHGYLLHEFCSPLTNHRTDDFGGPLANRTRFPLRIAASVRGVWPRELPVFVRISSTDWIDGGWDLPQSIALAAELKNVGIDLIDCSSGGAAPGATIPTTPGYQVPFAEAIRRQAGIATCAVGLISEPEQAESIIATGQADAVALARQELRDPYWPLHAAKVLGAEVAWPKQYLRGKG